VAARVRGWGLPGVAWWVSGVTRPAGTEDALRDRGAGLIDAVQVLARELTGRDEPLQETMTHHAVANDHHLRSRPVSNVFGECAPH